MVHWARNCKAGGTTQDEVRQCREAPGGAEPEEEGKDGTWPRLLEQ